VQARPLPPQCRGQPWRPQGLGGNVSRHAARSPSGPHERDSSGNQSPEYEIRGVWIDHARQSPQHRAANGRGNSGLITS
jgi:hypothetical protein